jgi:hypothetical protein
MWLKVVAGYDCNGGLRIGSLIGRPLSGEHLGGGERWDNGGVGKVKSGSSRMRYERWVVLIFKEK